MEHLNALPAGTRLGEYEIESVLGAGGFGITYRAYDANLKKVVALKEYLPSEIATRTHTRTVMPTSPANQAGYKWGLERFLDEARTLARFDHPHLNKVHRYFEAHGTAYLVLEYIEGEPLSAVLRQHQALRQGEVKRILANVLSGLEAVHAAGYVHRDLKPGNLMVQPDGSVVVLDFGAARQAVGQRSKSITSILTPGYAPIEQYDTKAEDVGPWSDMYALGMVAYRCISGLGDADLSDAVTRSRAARKGSGDLEAAASIGRGRYDERLLDAIDWAIQVEETDRPQSIGEWRTALPPLDDRKPPPVSRPPRPLASESGQPTSVLPRWATILGGLVLIVAVGAGAYWLGQRGSGVPPEQVTAPTSATQESQQATSPTPHEAVSAPSVEEGPVVASAPAVPELALEPPDPAAMEATLGLGREERIIIQRGLHALEYASGPADGAFGPSTRQALEQWQQAKGYPATGYLDRGQADALLAVGREVVPVGVFVVETEPAEARIRLLNIPERYEAGMALPAGEYRVEVSAAGYQTATETVVHGSAPTERRIALARAGRQPGERFRDCPTCPELVVVPSGTFLMGSPSYEARRDDDEGPVHRVTIAQPFAVGVYEVTFAEWDACVNDGGCKGYRPDDEGWGRGQRPVINVNWHDTQAYVRWLSQQTGKSYRLLSESEWEYVARAGSTTPFHFGATIRPSQASYDGSFTYGGGRRGQGRGRTVPVGSFESNAFGLYDVHGNVWEWVQDCWNENYVGAPSDGRAWERGDCGRRVLRGGSWNNWPRLLRSAFRSRGTAVYRYDSDVGFRIARSFP